MWKESMQQCSCKMERISYDDFLLLMKGQARRESYRPSIVWNPLRPEDQAILEELAEESSGGTSEQDQREGSCNKQTEDETPQIRFGRKRSKSLDTISWGSDISSLDGSTSRRTSMPTNGRIGKVDVGVSRPITQNAATNAPLLAAREEYKKHLDFRMAIIEASKDFDTKQQALRTATPLPKAGLIMKRGSEAPQDLEELHQRALFDAAIRRGGRQALDKQTRRGHRKRRTQSDITGLLKAGFEVAQ